MKSEKQSRPRTASRVASVQALFQIEQSGALADAVIDEFLRHRLGKLGDESFEDGGAPEAQAPLFKRIVGAATRDQEKIDALLSEALSDEWPIARLDPVLRALMRAGSSELCMRDGPPAKVVINEYLDIAHGFFDGEEPGMVNGVLDKLARSLRAGEFAG